MLLNPDEITIEALMADLPMQRSALNQLRMQLLTLSEGLELDQNPLQQQSPVRQHIVAEGETLPIVAVRLWGKADLWRSLAETNGIQYPYLIWAGQVLQIPDIPHG